MSAITGLVTAEQLLLMTGEGRRELVKGELRVMAPAGFDHGAIITNLAFLLARHVRERKLGVVTGAETGFTLARNPDTVRGPDIAFVAASRLGANRPQEFWEGAPDLAVEVLSPGDTIKEIEEKVDDYLAAGTRAVWVVNPRRKTVTVHRPDAKPTMLRENEQLSGDDVVPGFDCSVADIFA